jgi:hypothetical protein
MMLLPLPSPLPRAATAAATVATAAATRRHGCQPVAVAVAKVLGALSQTQRLKSGCAHSVAHITWGCYVSRKVPAGGALTSWRHHERTTLQRAARRAMTPVVSRRDEHCGGTCACALPFFPARSCCAAAPQRLAAPRQRSRVCTAKRSRSPI